MRTRSEATSALTFKTSAWWDKTGWEIKGIRFCWQKEKSKQSAVAPPPERKQAFSVSHCPECHTLPGLSRPAQSLSLLSTAEGNKVWKLPTRLFGEKRPTDVTKSLQVQQRVADSPSHTAAADCRPLHRSEEKTCCKDVKPPNSESTAAKTHPSAEVLSVPGYVSDSQLYLFALVLVCKLRRVQAKWVFTVVSFESCLE